MGTPDRHSEDWFPTGMDPITNFLLEVSVGLDIPCTPSIACPSLAAASQSSQPSSSQHNNPTTSQQPPEPSDEPEHDPDDDDDDDDGYLANPEPHNEHVGVDDEGLYLPSLETHVGGGDVDGQSESDSESDVDYEEEEGLIGKDPVIPMANVAYDRDNPPMTVGSLYPNMKQFRLALCQYAIKNEFEYNTEKSDPARMRAYCSRKETEGCRWRLYASTYRDGVTIKVRKNPRQHTCSSARRSKVVKNATKFWICDQIKDWLMEDSSLRAKELQRRIKDKHKVEVPYKRVYAGQELAQKELFGSWDSSFNNLYRFKAEIERCSPGSFVVIDHHKIGDQIRFNRLFFAMKPCIDGFLNACRPYLAIDSIFGHIPCKHAIAFITSLGEPLEKYVDTYYSVEKFKAAYGALIPAMPDKGQWPQSDHGFFMHPPLIKSTAGRRQNERFKGCTEASGGTRPKGKHRCNVCKGYGHRWYNCKDGDPEDIAALLAEKGPPKKKKKTTIPSNESSIVPIGSTQKTMQFPPSQSASATLGSGDSLRSGSGSNQLEQLSIVYPMLPTHENTPPPASSKPRKGKDAKGKAKTAGKNKKKQVPVPHDSPAMGTRSKTAPHKHSPASHTRSKRKLSLPDLNV